MKNFLRIDFFLLLPVVILVSISLVTLLSLNVAYFKSQLISVLIGFAAFFIFSQINIDFFKQFKGSIYILSIIFLLVTLAIGIQSHGAVRWIGILGAQLQFSEILKPFFITHFLRHSWLIKLKFQPNHLLWLFYLSFQYFFLFIFNLIWEAHYYIFLLPCSHWW